MDTERLRWGFGEVKGQGTRTDIAAAVEEIDSGKEVVEIVRSFPKLLRCVKGLLTYKELVQRAAAARKPGAAPEVHILYGPTGTGKTHAVFAEAEEKYGECDVIYRPTQGSGHFWWNDYDASKHKVILFDEFRGSSAPPREILQICDKYPMNLPTKGGLIARGTVDHVYFTSNLHPEDWWPNIPAAHGWEPLKRRTTDLRELSIPFTD